MKFYTGRSTLTASRKDGTAEILKWSKMMGKRRNNPRAKRKMMKKSEAEREAWTITKMRSLKKISQKSLLQSHLKTLIMA